jgi:hypothetical protein
VATNKNVPPEALVRLSKYPEYPIRMRVASNPSTPVDTLKKLAKDRNSAQVRRTAISTLERLGIT